MMINRNDLINNTIEADVQQSHIQHETGYQPFMYYNHVDTVANLLGVDKENLRNAVQEKFHKRVLNNSEK